MFVTVSNSHPSLIFVGKDRSPPPGSTNNFFTIGINTAILCASVVATLVLYFPARLELTRVDHLAELHFKGRLLVLLTTIAMANGVAEKSCVNDKCKKFYNSGP